MYKGFLSNVLVQQAKKVFTSSIAATLKIPLQIKQFTTTIWLMVVLFASYDK